MLNFILDILYYFIKRESNSTPVYSVTIKPEHPIKEILYDLCSPKHNLRNSWHSSQCSPTASALNPAPSFSDFILMSSSDCSVKGAQPQNVPTALPKPISNSFPSPLLGEGRVQDDSLARGWCGKVRRQEESQTDWNRKEDLPYVALGLVVASGDGLVWAKADVCSTLCRWVSGKVSWRW